MKRTLEILVLGVAALAIPVLLNADVRTSRETSATHLVGLWDAVREFGPEVKGELTLSLTESPRRASVAGFESTVHVSGQRVSFSIAGDRGRFTGLMSVDSSHIDGHWVQPPTVAGGRRYATPVHLTRTDHDRWQGDVAPLEDRMTMHLLLRSDDSGHVGGILRNPESNFGRFFHIAQAVIEGGQVLFRESGRANVRLRGEYHEEDSTFSVYLPDAGGTFDFHRADEASSRFYPRPRTDPLYTYRIPEQRDDGWTAGSLAEVGMAKEPIEEMIRRIVDTPIDAIDAPYIHAVLIARHGKLVLEEYFHGYHGDQLHDTRSAGKSVTSTLIGIAMNRGVPISLQTPVYQVMYDGEVPPSIDMRKRSITVEHLLTMTTGWDCFDGNRESIGDEDRMQSQTEQPDWWQYTLDLPMVNEPGTVAAYCSASPNLAGGVLGKITGMWLPEFYQHFYAAPLGISQYAINLMPSGEAYGGGGIQVRPRDFLKLGQVFLDSGQWNDESIVSSEWATAAVSPKVNMWKEDYGYGWWIIPYTYKGQEITGFYAGGNGGQYIIGIPELDVNIVFFAANYGQSIMHLTKREFVPDYILRSVELGE